MVTNLDSEVKETKFKFYFRCMVLNNLWKLTELNVLIWKVSKNNTYLIGLFWELNE